LNRDAEAADEKTDEGDPRVGRDPEDTETDDRQAECVDEQHVDAVPQGQPGR
jgi:hypothetical protein